MNRLGRGLLGALGSSALFLVACGGDAADSPGSAEADLTAPKAEGSGTISGKDPAYKEAAAMGLTRLKDEQGKVTLSGVTVQLSSGPGMCSVFQKKVAKLELHVQNNEGVLDGQVFKIGTN